MAQMLRYRCPWTGIGAGPAMSTFYSDGDASSPDISAALVAFFTGFKNNLPSGATISFPQTVDVLDPANGKLTGTLPVAGGTPAVGTSVGNFSSVTGMLVSWTTADYVNGHRVRGRTYMVPTGALPMALGVPTSTAITSLTSWATGLRDATVGKLKIWARPVDADHATPHSPARSGSMHSIVGVSVPAYFVVLRSRRN